MAYGQRDLEQFRARLAELRATLAPPTDPGHFVAYTDGACFGNPDGPGGWAAATFPFGGIEFWHLFGHLSSTSNNRAEALGVLGALEWVPAASTLDIHSDSMLTVNQLQGRYKIRANTDIWDVIRATREAKQLQLQANWVRGHVGDPLNDLADRLSKIGAANGSLKDLDRGSVPRRQTAVPELEGLQPSGDWEREFLASIAQQLRGGRKLSPKQQAIVDRIRARAGA